MSMSTAPCRLESLEGRQLLTTFGTMNVSDAGTGAAAIITYSLNGVSDFAEAGIYQMTRSASSPGTYKGKPAPGATFDTFCLEPDQDFPTAPTTLYKVVDLESAPPQASARGSMGAAKANQLRELWGRFRNTVGTDGAKAAAFQLALWEIVTDTGKNLATGAFRAVASDAASTAIKNQAQAWLDQVNGAGPRAELLALSNPCDQDLVFEAPPALPCKPIKCHPVENDCKPEKPRHDCKPQKDDKHCKPKKDDRNCKPSKGHKSKKNDKCDDRGGKKDHKGPDCKTIIVKIFKKLKGRVCR